MVRAGPGIEGEFGEAANSLIFAVKRAQGADPVGCGSQVRLRAINWVDSKSIPSDT